MATVFNTQTRGPQTLSALYAHVEDYKEILKEKLSGRRMIKLKLSSGEASEDEVKVVIKDINQYINTMQSWLIQFAWRLPEHYQEKALEFVSDFWKEIQHEMEAQDK